MIFFNQVQVVGSVQMARGVSGTISVWPAVKSTTTVSVALRASRTLAHHVQRQDTFNLSASSALSLPCERISTSYAVLDAGPYNGMLIY